MLPGIGIFGTGSLVKIIVPYLKDRGFKIEAIWGESLVKAEELSKALDIQFFTNKIDHVLLRKDVDLIFIMCSPSLQAEISVKALNIGKHVVCDKPAGLSQNEAIKMVHAAQYYPLLISIINHSLRFLPTFVQMKKSIADGYLGKSRYNDIYICDVQVQMESLYLDKYNWMCDKTMGGGILTLVGSHVIDLISYLLDQRATRVHGIVKVFQQTSDSINGIRNITSPDFCTFQMEMNEKTLVNVTLNSHLPGVYNQEIRISGKDGHLMVRGDNLYGYKKTSGKEEIIYKEPLGTGYHTSSQIMENKMIPRPFVKGLFKMIASLTEAFSPVEDKSGWVKEPVANASTFEDGLYVQAVIDAIYQSSSAREWVRVNMISEEPDPNPLLSAALRKTGYVR